MQQLVHLLMDWFNFRVLCGIIGSLLAQGYSPLKATIHGSLTHTMASANYEQNNYSMTPQDLINEIKKL